MQRRQFLATLAALAATPLLPLLKLPEPKLPKKMSLLERCGHPDAKISIPAQQELAKILAEPLIMRVV
jgi:hypothetical protein